MNIVSQEFDALMFAPSSKFNTAEPLQAAQPRRCGVAPLNYVMLVLTHCPSRTTAHTQVVSGLSSSGSQESKINLTSVTLSPMRLTSTRVVIFPCTPIAEDSFHIAHGPNAFNSSVPYARIRKLLRGLQEPDHFGSR